MTATPGSIYLVGAGPGDPGLITVRGLDLLRQADVIVHDRLIGRELLAHARSDAEIISVKEAPSPRRAGQAWVNDLLITHARAGRLVVRLKGGDPHVFGRGHEESTACRQAGVPCYVVAGVTSALAGPTAAGIPITQRGKVRSLAIVTARAASDTGTPPIDYDTLANIDTVIILMGRSKLDELARGLIDAGRAPDTPAACIQWATTTRQRATVGTLRTIAEAADRDDLRPPVVTVVGAVAAAAEAGGFRADGPLAGRRIVVTRSLPSTSALRVGLSVAGAIPVPCPVLKVGDPSNADPLDEAIRNLDAYNWLVFVSPQGVRGFWNRLSTAQLDARALASSRVAALGPATAAALAKRGILADVVPNSHTSEGLVDAIREAAGNASHRLLLLRADIAQPAMAEGLTRAGMCVDDVEAYRVIALPPPPEARRILQDGADAIVFCSPSAASRFVELELICGSAVIVSIGPTTAAATRKAGLPVHVVAKEHTGAGIVTALAAFFAEQRANA